MQILESYTLDTGGAGFVLLLGNEIHPSSGHPKALAQVKLAD